MLARAVEQADEADKVRDGRAARPLQLIRGVGPTFGRTMKSVRCVAVLLVLFGPAASPAGDQSILSTGPVDQRDNDVMVVALDRLLRDGREDPFMPFVDSAPLFFEKSPKCYPRTVEQVMCWPADYKWHTRLTQVELAAVREAAEHLVARLSACRGEFAMSHPRIRLLHGEPPRTGSLGKTITATLPGFSRDGRTALVLLSIPWSMHGASAAYVVTKENARWRVRLGELAYGM
jgi:hypothetical protein